jgi:cell wall-associated NlpC family hydrolase
MSFSDAIGQVDQIVQWEQQLSNPAALTQTTSSGGTATADDSTSTSASDGAGSSSFANMLAQAQTQDGSDATSLLDPTSGGNATGTASDLLGSGDSQLLAALTSSGSSGAGSSSSVLSSLESALQSPSTSTADGVAGLSGSTYATATSAADPRIDAMVQEANSLVGEPYVWGGGHSGWGAQAGYDCSGFVSAVLHAGGYLSSPADTTTLPSQAGIEQGPGQHVTIYDRDKPGQEGHVIIQIDGQFYESGGEQGSWGGGGGVQKISTPSASYLETFNQVLHPAGL